MWTHLFSRVTTRLHIVCHPPVPLSAPLPHPLPPAVLKQARLLEKRPRSPTKPGRSSSGWKPSPTESSADNSEENSSASSDDDDDSASDAKKRKLKKNSAGATSAGATTSDVVIPSLPSLPPEPGSLAARQAALLAARATLMQDLGLASLRAEVKSTTDAISSMRAAAKKRALAPTGPLRKSRRQQLMQPDWQAPLPSDNKVAPDEESDDEEGSVVEVAPTARGGKRVEAREYTPAPPSPSSSMGMRARPPADLSAQWLGKPIGTGGKAVVMSAVCAESRTPAFSKYAGLVRFSNAVVLFVNVNMNEPAATRFNPWWVGPGGAGDVRMKWWASDNVRSGTAVGNLLRGLAGGLKGPDVHLFARPVPDRGTPGPYVYAGEVVMVALQSNDAPWSVEWRLKEGTGLAGLKGVVVLQPPPKGASLV